MLLIYFDMRHACHYAIIIVERAVAFAPLRCRATLLSLMARHDAMLLRWLTRVPMLIRHDTRAMPLIY